MLEWRAYTIKSPPNVLHANLIMLQIQNKYFSNFEFQKKTLNQFVGYCASESAHIIWQNAR